MWGKGVDNKCCCIVYKFIPYLCQENYITLWTPPPPQRELTTNIIYDSVAVKICPLFGGGGALSEEIWKQNVRFYEVLSYFAGDGSRKTVLSISEYTYYGVFVSYETVRISQYTVHDNSRITVRYGIGADCTRSHILLLLFYMLYKRSKLILLESPRCGVNRQAVEKKKHKKKKKRSPCITMII